MSSGNLRSLLPLKCLFEHTDYQPFEPRRHLFLVIDDTAGQVLVCRSEIAPKPFLTCRMDHKSSGLALIFNQALLLLGNGLGNRTRRGHF